MPLEQTITVINNSGKIISTGKQLVSFFKDAKASYDDRKAQIRAERGIPPPERGIQRAQTFDTSQIPQRRAGYDEYGEYQNYRDYDDRDFDRRTRRSYDVRTYDDDGYSVASSRRSYQSRATNSRRPYQHGAQSRLALTENNLKTLSEVSSTAPSRAPPPMAYRSPYAETLPRDMALSKMDLTHADMRSIAPTEARYGVAMARTQSETQLVGRHDPVAPRPKEIDMDLAYGNVPPDLATRYDLDPAHKNQGGNNARDLVSRVEGLLDEAHCLQFGATSIIEKLKQDPEAAANVALTLADLSKAVAQVSPAALALLKGGSPAVFALLASPQFLIGTGIAVGCTIVMFGGWKIVKKVKESQAAKAALAYEGPAPLPDLPPMPQKAPSQVSAGIDEALVLEEELSTIETWRRGIEPFGENESADLELITPEAERVRRERHGKDDFDTKSHRSTRTAKTSKTVKTSKTSKSHKSKREDRDVPERKSSRQATTSEAGSKAGSRAGSEAGSERSKKSSRRREVKAIEDGKSRKGDDELDMVIRSRPHRQGDNMLKALFKTKKEREREMVMA